MFRTSSKGEIELVKIQVDLTCDKKCDACERFFDCQNPEKYKIYELRRMDLVRKAMSLIKYKIAVLAGKGGTGKSTVTTNLAATFAMKGYKVAILDHDFDGPCIHKMFGLAGKRLKLSKDGIVPITYEPLGIKIASTGLVMDELEALIWYHELRRGATEEFLCHVVWGENDFLFIDMPPGTSSDTVNILQHLPDLTGAIVVTVPSEVSQGVARRALGLLLKAGAKVLGVIENMSGFVCPRCNTISYILQRGAGERLAKEFNVPFLGTIPLDPRLSECADRGEPMVYAYPESPISQIYREIADKVEKELT